ncbi:MAG: ferritin-like domain-containing protein [Candidatus Paceibacterota bacterium]
MMLSIEELLKAQEITINHPEPNNETVAQEVPGYTTETVIELLKKSLNVHWQQTTSLSAQAIHLERWGYKKLAEIIKADAKEEHEHAMVNLLRLEFFDADYQPLTVGPQTWVRHDMVSMIKYNLDSVKEAAATENATITAARKIGDELTANIMIPLLQGSENGIVLYESFLKIIDQMGLDNFLSIQS